MPLLISSRLSGGTWIICPAGAMTIGSGSDRVRDMLIAKSNAGFRHLIIDCSKLTAIDSQALGEIVTAYSAISRRGGSLRLLQPNKRVRDLLRVTKIEGLLKCFDDEPSALQVLDAQPEPETPHD